MRTPHTAAITANPTRRLKTVAAALSLALGAMLFGLEANAASAIEPHEARMEAVAATP